MTSIRTTTNSPRHHAPRLGRFFHPYRDTPTIVSLIDRLRAWRDLHIARTGMWHGLDRRVYHRLQNISIPSVHGSLQIGHLLVSVHGLFLVDLHHRRGWIFGDLNTSKWTHSLLGKNEQFPNPLWENYRRIQALATHLGLDPELFSSVVFFIGDCTFKTPLPANVLRRGLASHIKTIAIPRITPKNVAKIVEKIQRLGGQTTSPSQLQLPLDPPPTTRTRGKTTLPR